MMIKEGDKCRVIKGTHEGKIGVAKDLHKSKTGVMTITVVENNGDRFKTLAKNVAII